MQWTYYAVLEAFLNPIIFIMKMRIRKPFEALERKRKANKVNHNGFEIIFHGEFICYGGIKILGACLAVRSISRIQSFRRFIKTLEI